MSQIAVSSVDKVIFEGFPVSFSSGTSRDYIAMWTLQYFAKK